MQHHFNFVNAIVPPTVGAVGGTTAPGGAGLHLFARSCYHGDMEKKRKSTTLRLTEQDIQAVLKIRQVYGIASDNQAIVFAILVLILVFRPSGLLGQQTPEKV